MLEEINKTQRKWGRRALEHAAGITAVSPGRGSATAGEARAAEYVLAQLGKLGIRDVHTQPFQGLRSIWFFLAFAFGVALSGHAAFWLLRIPLGSLLAVVASVLIFGFSAHLLWRKFTFSDYPLREYLPHGPSQNLVAVLPAKWGLREHVVLVAHLDSHRAVWCFASDMLVKIYSFLAPIGVYGVVAAPALYLLAVVSGLGIFSWLGAALGLVHFVSWFTGMTADLGPYSPGANDNASAVGTLLALAERLSEAPLEHTEVWLTFTGCEETGCDGMRTLLDEHGDTLSGALFLDFELVGIGERLVYLQSEGVVRRQRISNRVEALVLDVGGRFGIEPIQGAGMGAFTEMGTVWERGFNGVCLLALRENSNLFPEWHRLTDTADRLQAETLGRVHELAWALLHKVDG